jgi:photosystem II stability/assembly factor-like uncharacterized protein
VLPPRFSISCTLFVLPVALALLCVGLVPAAGPVPARERQIVELEAQIAELTRRLAELKSGPPKAQLALPEEWVKSLSWRGVGPASMGGRIVAFSVFEADPSTWWVATASGGLLKTTNNGVTFEHQFDREATVSIGDVCVAPSDRNIVWVGTGEHNPRNSVSYGDGVYKSTNGGKTWTNMGLKKSFQIGRIVVHPKNPEIVYVGALGRLYGPNEERGLYKTTDGGKTWSKVLQLDNETGVIELRMHPTDPETLLVGAWERRRDGFDAHAGALAAQFIPGARVDPPLADGYDAYDPIRRWGPRGGIYKTSDGGKSFRKITKGLPTNGTGRIGLDYYRKDPNIVFAVVDCEKIGMGRTGGYLGIQGADQPKGGARLTVITPGSPAEKAGLKPKDLVTALDQKPVKNYATLVESLGHHNPGDKLVFTVQREGKTVEVTATLTERPPPPGRRPLELVPENPRGGDLSVGSVTPGSSLDKAGLKRGDVVVSFDRTPLLNWRQYIEQVNNKKEGEKYTLTVRRGEETRTLTVVVPPVPPGQPVTRPYAGQLGGQRENAQGQQGADGFEYGGVYRSSDGGESWTRVNSLNPRPMYFSQIRVDPGDDKLVYVLGIRLHRSTDGGKTFNMGGDNAVHPDHHALWIDPRDGRHQIIGNDGGVYVTWDRGAHWDYVNTTDIGQFYHVSLDSRKPYRIYGGMQDNGSWGGPSHTLDGKGPINADWVIVNGGDGFVCGVDPQDPDLIYFESQDGNIGRRNLRTGERAFIRPRNQPGHPPYRFNWNTPFVISAHNPRVVYCAGSHVFRSIQRGDNFKAISDELCRTGQASATALAESPRNPDVLWVGTDDGNLWVTRNGGTQWTNVTERVGLPKHFLVASIEPSRFADGRAYVAFDAHRSDNDDPWVFVTENFGESWKSLRANLPWGSTRVCREDLANEDVLYLGAEFGVFASVDRGATWTRINANLPTVAVHELAQHPTTGEMVAATHGRSIWILDVSPLRQMKAATRTAAVTLFKPATATRWRSEPMRGTIYGVGSRGFYGQNPRPGATIYYALGKKAGRLRLTIEDVTGKTLATLPVKNEPGLHAANWNLQGPAGPRPPGLMGFLPQPTNAVPPGQYRVVLNVDGVQQIQGLTVENDPNLPVGTIIAEQEELPPPRVERRDD